MIRALAPQFSIAAVGLFCVAILVGFLSASVRTTVLPDSGGAYVEGVVGSPLTLNPVLAGANQVDRDIAALVFSGLIRIGPRGEPVPELAADWTLSPDGRVVSVGLRRDAFWHDGTQFGARDVVFTVRAIQDPKFRGPAELAEAWKGITAEQVDDFSVRFRLRDSFAPFLSSLSVGMLPWHLLKDAPADALPEHPFRANPIGTGRFRVRDTTGASVGLESNVGFYGQKALIKSLRIRFYSDRAALQNGLRAREVQGAFGLGAADVVEAGVAREFDVFTAPQTNFTMLFLNNRSPYFRDKGVRQALAYGMDRARLAAAASPEGGVVSLSPIPPDTWASAQKLPEYAFDVESARKLLDAAGWLVAADGIREKDGLKFRFSLLTNDDPARVRVAEEIARQVRPLGLRAEVSASGYSGLLEKFLAPRQFEAVLFGLDPGADPDGFGNWHSTQARAGGSNFISYASRRADDLIERARTTNDPVRRAAAYAEFQAVFLDDLPSLPLFYPVVPYAVHKSVRGVELGLLFDPSDRFRSVDRWFLRTKREMQFVAPDLRLAARATETYRAV